MERKPIAEVIAARAPELMQFPGVSGVYEGTLPDGSPCIKVIVTTRSKDVARRLPARVEGYRVVVVGSDTIRAMPDSAP